MILRNTQSTNARDYVIVNLYKRGYTLQAIGEAYSLSKERVRQICNDSKVLYDSNFDIKTAPKISTSQTGIFYKGQYYSRMQFLKKYCPELSFKEKQNVISCLVNYSKKNKKDLSKCFIKYVETKDDFFNELKIVYKGKEYKNQQMLFKELFPDIDSNKIYQSVSQRMRKYGLTFEEAINVILDKGYPARRM